MGTGTAGIAIPSKGLFRRHRHLHPMMDNTAGVGNGILVPLRDMDTVTLSPKFQVVIPQTIREALGLRAGEKLKVMHYANRVEFIPILPIQEMRGFLRGMDTTIVREDG